MKTIMSFALTMVLLLVAFSISFARGTPNKQPTVTHVTVKAPAAAEAPSENVLVHQADYMKEQISIASQHSLYASRYFDTMRQSTTVAERRLQQDVNAVPPNTTRRGAELSYVLLL